MRFVTKRLRWILVGAGAAWLFDPVLGPQRRERLARKGDELLDRMGIRPTPVSSPAGPAASDVAWASASATRPGPAVDERSFATSATG
jgi:hypothetical protein